MMERFLKAVERWLLYRGRLDNVSTSLAVAERRAIEAGMEAARTEVEEEFDRLIEARLARGSAHQIEQR